MSKWITDRRPTREDGDTKGYVWATAKDGNVRIMGWEFAAMYNLAWMPITPPEPYVKPKRWTVRFNPYLQCWSLHDRSESQLVLYGLDRYDEHLEAAKEIANIYERELP